MIAFLPFIIAALQAFPQIIAAIKAAEAAIEAPKAGAQKKALVMAAVSTPDAPPAFVAHVSDMIDSHVAALNAASVFKRAPAVPAAPAASAEAPAEQK